MRLARSSHVIAYATLVVAMAAGCRRGELVAGVNDSTFVATMAELRATQQRGLDSAELARARQGVLQRRGLTLEQLERAANALADDPERAANVWHAIDIHVMRGEEGAVRPPTVTPP